MSQDRGFERTRARGDTRPMRGRTKGGVAGASQTRCFAGRQDNATRVDHSSGGGQRFPNGDVLRPFVRVRAKFLVLAAGQIAFETNLHRHRPSECPARPPKL